MKKMLKLFDRFAGEFHFTYKGKNKLQNQLGGILTIFAMILIIFNGFLIGKDIFYKQNPSVLSFEKNFEYNPITRFNYSNMFFGIAFSNDTYFFDDDSILSVVPYLNIHYRNKNKILKNKRNILELTNCSSEFERLKMTPPFMNGFFKSIKCIKNLDFILSGSWKENPIHFLNFEIRACKNHSTWSNVDSFNEDDKNEYLQLVLNLTSSNQLELKYFPEDSYHEYYRIMESSIYSNSNYPQPIIKCKSQEEIKMKIPSLYLNFYYNEISIDSRSYKNPFNSQAATDWVKLGNNQYKESLFRFNHYIMSTDNGLIFNDPSIEDVKVGYKQSSLDFIEKKEDDDLLMEFSIYISNNVQYFNRQYIKVQSIFANLGGIMKLIFFFFEILYNPFSNKKRNLKIVNKIFEFDEKNNEKNHKFNNDLQSNINNVLNKINYKDDQEKVNIHKNDFSDSGRNNLNMNEIQSKFPKKKTEILGKKNNIFRNNYPKFSNSIEMKKNIGYPININNSELNRGTLIKKKQKEKKLKFHNREIFNYLYCRYLCRNSLLEKKNEMLTWASENLFDYTDYLKMIKLHTDVIKLKFIIFNINQLQSYELISNPKKYKNEIFHHSSDFAQVFQKETDKTVNIADIIEYFKDRIKYKDLNVIDEKLLDLIDPEFKNLIFAEK